MGATRARSRLLVVVIVSAVACTDTDRDDVTEVRSAVLAPNTNGAQIQSFVLDATETISLSDRASVVDADVGAAIKLPPSATRSPSGSTAAWPSAGC